MYPRSMADSDCIVIQGSNMAECHPVAFRWPMQAKLKGAKLIHVDPRFTRTSAVADIHAPIRAGSDVAFLGGLIRYVLESERWKGDPFFKEFVVNYTNAATIVGGDFKDTEDVDGVFSGLMQYAPGIKEWPLDGFVGQYDTRTWQYAAAPAGAGATRPPDGPPFDTLVRSLLTPPPRRDETLKHPRTVFQIVKRHFSRYTPEMVERVTGCPRATFLEVAETILANSGRDRTTSFAYAVAWTQHTNGPQTIGCCALLQLLLGNVGRPGAGVMALRGHASIQGSTDIATLYHSIHGYMSHPSALRPHETLRDYMAAETSPTSYYGHLPKFLVSYLKSMSGTAATAENDFGYDWHPKILGDHSHIASFAAMAEGKVKGMCCVGQNPATSLNGGATRRALRQLDWVVVKDNWLTETATYWYLAPEVKSGEVKIDDIKTEVFFFPSTQIAEYDGSFTNTQRMLQWHSFAAKAPGDCRTDSWFYHNLAKRLKKAYAGSKLSRDQGWNNVTWDFDPDAGEEPLYPGEISARKVLREINGYQTADPKQHLKGFGELKDDGSTTCASWIYCGCYPAWDQNLTARSEADPPGVPGAHLKWGWAWPANRRVMYNRASADLKGNPWSERKRWVWWDPTFVNPPDPKTGKAVPRGKWVGYDVPDFGATKAPDAQPKPDGIALDALSGTQPFIMRADGRGWLLVPAGLVDGALPTHYEPHEKPIHHVGMPWHWGWMGLSTGDVVNDLTSWVGDPNVSIHEGKAFVCNVEKAGKCLSPWDSSPTPRFASAAKRARSRARNGTSSRPRTAGSASSPATATTTPASWTVSTGGTSASSSSSRAPTTAVG